MVGEKGDEFVTALQTERVDYEARPACRGHEG
jgi:hypothetical protein